MCSSQQDSRSIRVRNLLCAISRCNGEFAVYYQQPLSAVADVADVRSCAASCGAGFSKPACVSGRQAWRCDCGIRRKQSSTPYSQQADVAIQQALDANTSITVNYLWSRAAEMLTVRDLKLPARQLVIRGGGDGFRNDARCRDINPARLLRPGGSSPQRAPAPHHPVVTQLQPIRHLKSKSQCYSALGSPLGNEAATY